MDQSVTSDLIVNDDVWKYLVIQRGDLHQYKDDREAWLDLYKLQLEIDLEHIHQACPHPADVLDIGSGVGAIDVMLAKLGSSVHLLDGEDALPIMFRQDVPFNARKAVKSFFADNGITKFSYMSPHNLYPVKVDLVLSFRSWCFHYPPVQYLEFVKQCCKPSTRLLIDVRKDRMEWLSVLKLNFHMLGSVVTRRKFHRVMFEMKR